MSLPLPWIDRIFDKLTVVYGREFTSRYEKISIADVKTEWCECLGGFRGHSGAIAFALENLPEDRPPSMLQFRALCRNAPQYAALQLPPPKADPSIVAEQLRKMAETALQAPKTSVGTYDPKAWAKKLKERHESGEKLNLIQIEKYQKALGIQKGDV